MMAISDLLTRHCIQTAVYWAPDAPDGYGGMTYDDPVEISCRWEDKAQLFADAQGRQISSRSVVFVLEDLELEGCLLLGELDDIDSSDLDDPIAAGARVIINFDKIPALGSTTDYVRKAYL